MRIIVQNAGGEGSIVVEKIRQSKDNNYGYNALTDEYEDLVAAGVIDPTKVTRTALQNAASIAGLLLTTEALIVEKKEPQGNAPAGGPPGGMGSVDVVVRLLEENLHELHRLAGLPRLLRGLAFCPFRVWRDPCRVPHHLVDSERAAWASGTSGCRPRRCKSHYLAVLLTERILSERSALRWSGANWATAPPALRRRAP